MTKRNQRGLKTYDEVEPKAKSRDDALVREAKNLARLQAVRRQLRKRLRDCDTAIKATKRNLRNLMAEGQRPWDESGAKSKITPGGD